MGYWFILVIVGLVICFGGIYIKKLCFAVLGFTWGTIGSLLVMLLTIGLWRMSEEDLAKALLIGVVLAIISAIFDKISTALSGLISTLSFGLMYLFLVEEPLKVLSS